MKKSSKYFFLFIIAYLALHYTVVDTEWYQNLNQKVEEQIQRGLPDEKEIIPLPAPTSSIDDNNRPVEAFISTEWFATNTNADMQEEGFTRKYESKLKDGFHVTPAPSNYQARLYINADYLGKLSGNPYFAWKQDTSSTQEERSARNP